MENVTAAAAAPSCDPASPAGECRTSFEDLACCDICGEGDWEDDNNIIFCDSCNVAVHQVCYGAGARHIPTGDDPWYCDACRASGKKRGDRATKQECVLCPSTTGALKRTTDARWAHVACALWVPGVQFLDVEGRDIIHPYGVHPKRLELRCSVCEKPGGACIQCKHGNCLAAFHVTCAQAKGLHMVEKEKGDHVVHEAYCKKHTPQQSKRRPKRKREAKWP
jgi:NuA3 HAT complex component NTO1